MLSKRITIEKLHLDLYFNPVNEEDNSLNWTFQTYETIGKYFYSFEKNLWAYRTSHGSGDARKMRNLPTAKGKPKWKY